MIVVLIDLREVNGFIVPLKDDNGNVAKFNSDQEVRDCMRKHSLHVFTWIVVNVDDLSVDTY